jgi:hypothetical protein
MERQILLITPEQRKKLNMLAKQEKVSVAEINRRAIDQYFDFSGEELKALEVMAQALAESNKRSEQALDEAKAELNKTLKQLRERK